MRTRTVTRPLVTGAAAVAVLAVLAASCAQLPLHMIFDPSQREGDPPWVTCETLETFSEITRTVTGGAAGTLTLPRGHTLHVPATAVPAGQSVDITFMQLAGTGVAVRLRPRGHRFEDSLTLTLSYQGRNCDVSGGNARIYRVAQGGEPNEVLPRPDRPGIEPPSSVPGRLIRFSSYALAR